MRAPVSVRCVHRVLFVIIVYRFDRTIFAAIRERERGLTGCTFAGMARGSELLRSRRHPQHSREFVNEDCEVIFCPRRRWRGGGEPRVGRGRARTLFLLIVNYNFFTNDVNLERKLNYFQSARENEELLIARAARKNCSPQKWIARKCACSSIIRARSVRRSSRRRYSFAFSSQMRLQSYTHALIPKIRAL